jgi:hypothetical protein
MAHSIENTLESLKEENLELKLGAINKELASFKIDMHRHLDLILEQTSKTNGSVAKAIERISAIERENNKKEIENLKEELNKTKRETGFLRLLYNHKWVAILVVSFMYLFTIQEVRQLVFNWIKILG